MIMLHKIHPITKSNIHPAPDFAISFVGGIKNTSKSKSTTVMAAMAIKPYAPFFFILYAKKKQYMAIRLAKKHTRLSQYSNWPIFSGVFTIVYAPETNPLKSAPNNDKINAPDNKHPLSCLFSSTVVMLFYPKSVSGATAKL